jgi:RNA polymerase sigma-70 factor (ECF subfamily)
VIEGYSHKEIAEMLGIEVGTSTSNLNRARKKLQELIVLNEF